MKVPLVCLKIWVSCVVCFLLAMGSAFAQEKHFKVTDDGKHYYFNDATIQQNKIVNGENSYTRPITPRTFFLEAKNAYLFPESLTFIDFERMTIAQKQHLLDSLQPNFDWSKYQLNLEEEKPIVAEEKPDTLKPDLQADTAYSIQNLTFDKESSTLAGDLVSGTGRKQQFMIYPIASKNSSGNIRWVFEWIEPELYFKKKGYRNLDLPEQKIYQALKNKGIDLTVLSSLIE